MTGATTYNLLHHTPTQATGFMETDLCNHKVDLLVHKLALCVWRALTSWKGDWSLAKKKKSVGHDEDSAAFPWRFNRNCVRTQGQISENMHVRTGTAVIAAHPSNKSMV